MLRKDKLIDVIIPRGGHGLIRTVLRLSTIPVIRHDIGNCHVYVDKGADLEAAHKIAFNAKVSRPGVCNSMEHLLVHRQVAARFIPGMVAAYQKAGVEVRGDSKVRRLAKGVRLAAGSDWYAEYLSLKVGIKVVASLDEAISHINHFGSHHSDSIVSRDKFACERFLQEVDSAAVYSNASTRFTDGGEFGLGAEIGISTQKLHARGPMALEELCSIKWVIRGSGQVRG
jgi:glutamate-5-semialdehyde dehydrogenase